MADLWDLWAAQMVVQWVGQTVATLASKMAENWAGLLVLPWVASLAA